MRAALGRARPCLRLRHAAALLRPPPDHAQKKTAHASEQERPDILKRREAWFEAQPDLDPSRLVFIDETWAKTNMARTHGRAPRGDAPAGRRAARPLEDHHRRRRPHASAA